MSKLLAKIKDEIMAISTAEILAKLLSDIHVLVVCKLLRYKF